MKRIHNPGRRAARSSRAVSANTAENCKRLAHHAILPLLVFAVSILIVNLAPTIATAQKRTYALDEDPIRLGNKALEQGQLSDAENHYQAAVTDEYQVHKAMYGLAEVAVREGRYGDAEPLYRQALEVRSQKDNADYPEARAALGLLLLRYERDQEAAQEFDRVLHEKSNLWDALYGQARLRLKLGEWNEAKGLLDRGADRRGLSDGEDQYHHGMALYWLGKDNLAEAEKAALAALNLNPAEPEYGTLVGKIYDRHNAPTLAIDAYEKARSAPGMVPTAPMLHTLGGLYRKIKSYNEARDRYLEAVSIDSTYAPVLKDLADLFRLANQHDRAARTYLRYIQLESNDIEALLGLAGSCCEIRKYEQAIEAARAALALDDSREDVRLAVARAGIHSRSEDAKVEAARLFAQLPETLDWRADDFIALAAYQTAKKQHSAARSSLDKALALDPKHPNAYFQRGVIDLHIGDPASAIAQFEKAISLKPESPIYHLNLGIANYQASRLTSAIPAFREAVRLKDDLTVGRLLLAQALAASDSVAAAEVEYRKVVEVEPANAKALRGLGFCHIRKANYSEAIRIYRTVTAADPQNADGWAGLGNAYLGLENWTEAESAFAKARAIDPENVTMQRGFQLLQQARNDGGS